MVTNIEDECDPNGKPAEDENARWHDLFGGGGKYDEWDNAYVRGEVRSGGLLGIVQCVGVACAMPF